MPLDQQFVHEVPSAAGGDEGLEGFSVESGAQRIGRVAALNETPEGLVLVVDTGDAYRPVSTRFVAQIDTGAHAIRLTSDGEAPWPLRQRFSRGFAASRRHNSSATSRASSTD